MDNTYKVNRFNMPLLQITGITSLHTNFSVAFGVAAKEDEEAFTWLLEELDKVRQLHKIDPPGVIISDFDDAFKSAARRVFSPPQQQLCLWHIMKKNVKMHVRQKWLTFAPGEAFSNSQHQANASAPSSSTSALPSSSATLSITRKTRVNRRFEDNPDGVITAFQEMTAAASEAEFNELWGILQRDFSRQQGILHYLRKVPMPVRKQFATYAVLRLRNYGIRSTQRVESSHHALKVYLVNRFCDLYELNEQIYVNILDREREYAVAFEKQISKRRKPYERHDQMRLLIHRVSWIAMDKLVEQIDLCKRALDPRDQYQLRRCTRAFTMQWGLPCCHKLFPLVQEGGFIQLKDLSSHWWLKADTPEQQQQLNERYEPDPDIIEAFRKRRPENEAISVPEAASTGRVHSREEIFDLQMQASQPQPSSTAANPPGKIPSSQGKKAQMLPTVRSELSYLRRELQLLREERQLEKSQHQRQPQMPFVMPSQPAQPVYPSYSQARQPSQPWGTNSHPNSQGISSQSLGPLPPPTFQRQPILPAPVIPSQRHQQPPPSAQVPGSDWCLPQQVVFTGHLQYSRAINSQFGGVYSGGIPNQSQSSFSAHTAAPPSR